MLVEPYQCHSLSSSALSLTKLLYQFLALTRTTPFATSWKLFRRTPDRVCRGITSLSPSLKGQEQRSLYLLRALLSLPKPVSYALNCSHPRRITVPRTPARVAAGVASNWSRMFVGRTKRRMGCAACVKPAGKKLHRRWFADEGAVGQRCMVRGANARFHDIKWEQVGNVATYRVIRRLEEAMSHYVTSLPPLPRDRDGEEKRISMRRTWIRWIFQTEAPCVSADANSALAQADHTKAFGNATAWCQMDLLVTAKPASAQTLLASALQGIRPCPYLYHAHHTHLWQNVGAILEGLVGDEIRWRRDLHWRTASDKSVESSTTAAAWILFLSVQVESYSSFFAGAAWQPSTLSNKGGGAVDTRIISKLSHFKGELDHWPRAQVGAVGSKICVLMGQAAPNLTTCCNCRVEVQSRNLHYFLANSVKAETKVDDWRAERWSAKSASRSHELASRRCSPTYFVLSLSTRFECHSTRGQMPWAGPSRASPRSQRQEESTRVLCDMLRGP